MEVSSSFVLPSHGNPIVLDWIKEGKAVFQPGPLETPCLVWQKAKYPKGYGCVWVPDLRRCVRASRLAVCLKKKSNRDDEVAAHHCDNPSCVNPHHIKVTSKSWNYNDCKSKLRHYRGRSARCVVCNFYAQTSKSKTCNKCCAIKNGRFCDCLRPADSCGGMCSKCYYRSQRGIK